MCRANIEIDAFWLVKRTLTFLGGTYFCSSTKCLSWNENCRGSVGHILPSCVSLFVNITMLTMIIIIVIIIQICKGCAHAHFLWTLFHKYICKILWENSEKYLWAYFRYIFGPILDISVGIILNIFVGNSLYICGSCLRNICGSLTGGAETP